MKKRHDEADSRKDVVIDRIGMKKPGPQQLLAQLRSYRPFDLEALLVEILHDYAVEAFEQFCALITLPRRGNPLLNPGFRQEILAGNERNTSHGREGHKRDEDWRAFQHVQTLKLTMR